MWSKLTYRRALTAGFLYKLKISMNTICHAVTNLERQ